MKLPKSQICSLFVMCGAAALGQNSVGCAAGHASSANATSVPESSPHELLGAPAPEVSVPVVIPAQGAGPVNSESNNGRVRLIDFWATWCEPCRLSFPKYEQLRVRYGDRIEFLAVSEDDEKAEIAAFAQETGVHFSLLWDETKSMAQSFSVEAMPTLFIVDPNGLVRHVHKGFRAGDEQQIDAVVRSLLD